MKFYRARETDSSAGQTFDSGSQGQIVALNALSKNLTSQMILFWLFSGVTTPFVNGLRGESFLTFG